MPYIRERCEAGGTVEIRKYYAPRFGVKGEKRMKRSKPSEETVRKANLRRAEKELRLLMNTNFDKSSWSITLTFKIQPTLEHLKESVTKYVRKLRDIAKRKKATLKYIYVYGIGKKRRHAHMIVSGLPADVIADAWTEGHMSQTKIYTENLRELASYFIKNAENSREIMKKEGIKPGRRWNASRNLEKPKIKKEIIKANVFKTDINVPKGYYIDKDTVFEGISDFTGLPFFEYTLIKMEEARCG